jgi:acetyltransferase-like isoleucine patch superfamily enzyme
MNPPFIHPQALVETDRIGPGTRVWAFAHILPKAVIGADCNICDHVFIENDVRVGDRVTVKCGVQLWDGLRVEDDVFIGPNATFTNDPTPRSRRHLPRYPETLIQRGASVGAGATILPGLTIGMGAMVGAGAVVTRSVPPHAVVVGNPARIVHYTDDTGERRPAPESSSTRAAVPVEMRVPGVNLYDAPVVKDLRGNLAPREVGKGLPFTPERCFVIFDVPSKEVRGEHAHRVCQQLLVCLRGSVSVACDDGEHRQEFRLDSPALGLYIPPMVWATQYRYSEDAVLQVFASHRYDSDDYIRDYELFLKEKRTG